MKMGTQALVVKYILILLFDVIRNASLDIVEQFETYEDYLDSQLTETDLDYLEDEELARQLVELGYRGLGDTLHREVRKIVEIILLSNIYLKFRILKCERDCCWKEQIRSIFLLDN